MYSIASVTGATSYTWTVPSGATISGSATGSSISVNFNSSVTTGTITVKANNACTSSAISSLAISGPPAQPGTISGNTSVCKSNTSVTYTIASVTGATSYSWTISGGATFVSPTNPTTKTAKVKFTTATSTTAVLTVKANNACGSSVTRTLTINVNLGCRVIENDNEVTLEEVFATYPNPVSDKVTIEFSSSETQEYKIQMVDMYGKLVLEKTIVATSELSKEPVSVQTLSDGVYFVRLLNKGAIIKTSRIVVEQSR